VTVFKLPPDAVALKEVLVPTFKDVLVGEITTVTVLAAVVGAALWHAAKDSVVKIKIAKVSGERVRRVIFVRPVTFLPPVTFFLPMGAMGGTFWARVLGSITILCRPCSPA
jgi:hypothetical protein